MLLQRIAEVIEDRKTKARREIVRIIGNASRGVEVDYGDACRVLDLLPAAAMTLDDVRAAVGVFETRKERT